MEDLPSQVDKMSEMFDYITKQVGSKEAGEIVTKLGLDNPHISRNKSIEEYKILADKFIKFRKILKGGD